MDKNQQQVFDKEIVENIAKTISAHFDYPWEFMQEQGRDNIRKLAESILHMLPPPQRQVEQELLSAAQEALEAGSDGDWQSARKALSSAIAYAGSAQQSDLELLAEFDSDKAHQPILLGAGTEKDAARYRWLRSNLGNTVSHWLCAEGGEPLDNEIDFWMAKSDANN